MATTTTTRRLLVATTASSSLNPNSSLSTDAYPPQPLVTVESDFVVIVAALLCALICVIGLFAVARCAWLRNSTTTTTTASTHSSYTSSSGLANKGLKKKVLHSFPKFIFDSNRHSLSSGGGDGLDDCCAICLAEFVDGDEIRVLPQCGHGFHAGCVDMWLSRRSSCPSCRRILVGGKNRCQNCGHLPAIAPRI